MENFLINEGIKDDTINQFIDLKGKSSYSNLFLNDDKIINNIRYLKSININCINDILLYETDILFKDKNELIKLMGSLSKDEIELINNDCSAIDFLSE